MNTELAPYHAHIYYELDDRARAERLHQELAYAKGLGDLANLLFMGEMRDQNVGPHPKPQFEVHFLEDVLPKVISLIEASGFRALVHPLTDDALLITRRWHFGSANLSHSIRRCLIRLE